MRPLLDTAPSPCPIEETAMPESKSVCNMLAFRTHPGSGSVILGEPPSQQVMKSRNAVILEGDIIYQYTEDGV
jgi:hypothetical protein